MAGSTDRNAPFTLVHDVAGLYIHVPFCTSKCRYCAFDSTAVSKDDSAMDRFVDEICGQIRRLSKAGLLTHVKTVYIGGGTPSHLGIARLGLLLQVLGLSLDIDGCHEVTCEVNPESFDEHLAKDLRALGVTRISMGVQSFDDVILRNLGRCHTAGKAHQAIHILNSLGMDFSIDLICGTPGQDIASWKQDLQTACSCGASHISIYPLSVEEGTLLYRDVEEGGCLSPDEDLQADMLLCAHDVLTQAGFRHYEIANYALPGHEAKHNSSYWTGAPYLGLGKGAASFLSSEWPGFHDDAVTSWLPEGLLDALQATSDSPCKGVRFTMGSNDCDLLEENLLQREHLMLMMRLADGLSLDTVSEYRTSLPGLHEALDDCIQDGLLDLDDGRYHLSRRGWPLANQVFSRILFC